jgi:hypothetical protein
VSKPSQTSVAFAFMQIAAITAVKHRRVTISIFILTPPYITAAPVRVF